MVEEYQTKTVGFVSQEIDTESVLSEDMPHFHTYTNFTYIIPNNNLIIEDYRVRESIYGPDSQNEGFQIKLKNIDQLKKIKNFIQKNSKSETGKSLHLSVSKVWKDGKEIGEEKSQLTVRVNSERVNFSILQGKSISIPFYELKKDNEVKDRNNYTKLINLFDEFIPSEELDLKGLSEETKREIKKSEWGEAVLAHMKDGDKCLKDELYHPALSSYIHCYEWGIISLLKEKGIKDIIKEEKDGNYYYYIDLIKEVNTFIEQKTYDKLKNLNKAERRWIAHHKSGKLLKEEIIAIRARLHDFLRELFLEKSD